MKKNSKVEASGRLTIGIDVSDQSSCYCYLNQAGEMCGEGKLPSTPEAFRQHFGGMARAVIALEAGTHSRWMSALLRECGKGVIGGNRGRWRLLPTRNKKTDRREPRTRAEIAGPKRP